MAKKRGGDKTTDVRGADAGEIEASAEAVSTDVESSGASGEMIVEAATPAFVADEALFLLTEVQTFLNKRSELADRLAREITATERRLEELRRTAALLSPDAIAAVESAKPEKKGKKPSLKKADKKPSRKPADESSPTEQAGDDASPEEVAA